MKNRSVCQFDISISFYSQIFAILDKNQNYGLSTTIQCTKRARYSEKGEA